MLLTVLAPVEREASLLTGFFYSASVFSTPTLAGKPASVLYAGTFRGPRAYVQTPGYEVWKCR